MRVSWAMLLFGLTLVGCSKTETPPTPVPDSGPVAEGIEITTTTRPPDHARMRLAPLLERGLFVVSEYRT